MYKDYNGAIADYTLAIKNKFDCVNAYFKRGKIRTLKGDFRGAIKDYNQVIQFEPNHSLAYVQRGWIYKKQGKKKEAIEDFKQAINIFYKKSMPNEIKNTPWWNTRIF
jgi:tetratricopeptide (TPR) repeat protein